MKARVTNTKNLPAAEPIYFKVSNEQTTFVLRGREEMKYF
jgi:hypothetical protein